MHARYPNTMAAQRRKNTVRGKKYDLTDSAVVHGIHHCQKRVLVNSLAFAARQRI
ncbi:MAG: hypothetical protein ACI9WS_001132 [Paraglaciecola psychrophila]|jgi:hypothetical protein